MGKKGCLAEPPFDQYEYLVVVWQKPKPGSVFGLGKVYGFTAYEEAVKFRLKQYDARIKKKGPDGHFHEMGTDAQTS